MTFDELVKIVKACGVAGAGGAGFPSYAKLDKKIDTVILNCAECEPLFKMHRQLLEKNAYEIITALDEIRQIVGAEQFIVAVKKKYTKTVEAVNSVLGDYECGKLSCLPEVYPMGDEVVLIYETTKRRVPAGNIPLSVGVCVFNVETVLNIYNAIHKNEPVTHKYVTIAGEVKKPATFCVPLGTSFKELIKLAGGKTDENAVVINGGPMTGKLATEYDVVTKTTNGVLLFPENHPVVMKRKAKTSVSAARARSVCCQCGMCTDLCPRNLLGLPVDPTAFMDAVANGATYKAKAVADAIYCVSCGLCEMYSCTQGLNPRSLIDEFKIKMRENGIAPKKHEEAGAVKMSRDYRQVPMKRLMERIDLVRYDKSAEIKSTEVKPKRVKIMLSQTIGAPSVPCVKTGDIVEKGQKIADANNGLSVPLHSSVDGKVADVTDKFIIIDRRGEK